MFTPRIVLPKVKADRVLLLDADIVTYDASYKVEDDQVENMYKRIDLKIKACMEAAGCAHVECHLTGGSNFRDGIATVQQYKGNRYWPDGSRRKEQPRHLSTARTYIMRTHKGILSENEEADDAISKRNWQILTGCDPDFDEAVIGTTDKDIGINPGYYMNISNDQIKIHKGFGEIYMTGSTGNTLKGYGLKFFLAQMLMGDGTDYIPGCPKVSTKVKEYSGLRKGGFGPKKAYEIINPCTTYAEGLAEVIFCYRTYVEEFWPDGITKHWRGNEVKRDALDLILEQGRLLWMRRAAGELWTVGLNYESKEKELWENHDLKEFW